MQKKLLLLLLLISHLSFSQVIEYSDNVKISVLTCGNGDELYSQFGHSAFRVQDFQKNLDIVYNYGMFDFTDPNFYTNFAKGKLIYKLGRNWYPNFYEQYEWENREVLQQELNLTIEQKKKVLAFLENNAIPKNAPYEYDFFYDNCATKIEEVLNKVLDNQLRFDHSYITTSYTFRDLINNNLPHNTWASVGINIALGSVIDIEATPKQHMFLPKYVYSTFEHTTLNGKPFVKESTILLEQDPLRINPEKFSIFSPIAVFSLIAIIILLLTYRDYKRKKLNKVMDFSLLFITGGIGLFILLLWFATNHTATAKNFNLLWAFFPNLIVAFIILFKRRITWLSKYYTLLIVLLLIQTLVWVFRIEVFAYAAIPFFIALLIRYFYAMKLS